MYQDIFIVGATGKVGKTLVSQIYDYADNSPAKHKTPTRIVGLASSTNFIYKPDGILPQEAKAFSQKEHAGIKHPNVARLLSLTNPHVVYIDATAGKAEMLDFHLQAIRRGNGVVTANKNPLVDCDYATFRELTRNPQRYGYRCSVMAGAEAVSKVRDLKDLNAAPYEISGCFSGTLGYLTTGLELGKDLSAVVRDAYEKGYTEPHPADDLSGEDVAKKILILARTAGFNVGRQNIDLSSFVPHFYLNQKDPHLFMERLGDLDTTYHELFFEATAAKQALRYVASMVATNNQPTISVGFKRVPKDSSLGVLRGTVNKVVIKTPLYDPHSYDVCAPGAGLSNTAFNIRRDLLEQQSERKLSD